MTEYQYKAHSRDTGQVISSVCVAETPKRIQTQLKYLGYIVDEIKPTPKVVALFESRRVKLQELANFCRRFSLMVQAGLPLMECLTSLMQDNQSPALSKALHMIHDDIQSGANVADAFGKHPTIFTPIFVNMIRAGESAGEFDYILQQLANYLEKEYDLKRKIQQALAYPVIVVVMIFVVITAIMIGVFPVFSQIYTKMGITLPGPTLTLIFLSQQTPWILGGIIGLIGIMVVSKRFLKTSKIRETLDHWRIRLPIIGPLIHHVVLLRFLRTLAVMVKAGIVLEEAVKMADEVAHNGVASEAAGLMTRSILRGGSITDAAKLHHFFPNRIIQAFAAGEESGSLDEMLVCFCESLEQDVDQDVKRLVSMIEPILVTVLSAMIGFILLAIYLPIFDLMKGLRQ